MRKDFADKVIKKIPIKSEWTREKIIDVLRKRLFESQPLEVQKFSKKYPEQTNWTSVIADFLNYRDGDSYKYGRVNCIYGSSLKNIETEDLKKIYINMIQELRDRKEMRNRIYEQSLSANTLEQLKVIFPGMVGLMPIPSKQIRTLPVAAKGLTQDLIKLGLKVPT